MHFLITFCPRWWVFIANAVIARVQALEVSSILSPDHPPFFSNDYHDPMLFNIGVYELSEELSKWEHFMRECDEPLK